MKNNKEKSHVKHEEKSHVKHEAKSHVKSEAISPIDNKAISISIIKIWNIVVDGETKSFTQKDWVDTYNSVYDLKKDKKTAYDVVQNIVEDLVKSEFEKVSFRFFSKYF